MKKILIVAVASSLLGCASAGVKVAPEQLTDFKPGVTTMAQVVEKLGQPTGTQTSSNGESTLVYSYGESRIRGATFIPIVGLFAGGTDTRSTAVKLRFGQDGKLIDYDSSSSAQGASLGGRTEPVSDQPRR